MRFITSSVVDDVAESTFVLDGLTGVFSYPTLVEQPLPVLLLAHGGGEHAKSPAVLKQSRRFAQNGYAVVALDAPGHGGRLRTAADDQFDERMRALAGPGEEMRAEIARHNDDLAKRAVPEWSAILDAVNDLDGIQLTGRVGFYGISLGTAIGIPLIPKEPRINAAVLGLAGHDRFLELAARITVPVQFLLQWNDEIVPRMKALQLFDAFGSPEKTLHANLGQHSAVPDFEFTSAIDFLGRYCRLSPKPRRTFSRGLGYR